MPRTYEPIASQTLGSATATITFDNIGATWTDLVLVTDSKRSVGTTGGADFAIRFNNDSGGNYSATYVQGNGSSASSGRASSQTSMLYFATAETSATGNGVSITHICSYANTNVFKTVLSAGSAPMEFVRRHVGLWRSTAAVTRVDAVSLSGDFKSGSTFALYGIKAA